jgi:hypothetical protein
MHVLAMTLGNVCGSETRVPNAIIGTNQLRAITPTENPRASKVAGVEHKASNLVL